MNVMPSLEIDTAYLNDLKESLLHDCGLIIRSISEKNRSFERALSISLFGNEEEVDLISDTLDGQRDWPFDNSSNEDDSYITLAAQTYGITIHIHNNESIKLYELECDCPIIHLIKLSLKDGSYIYLGTEQIDGNNIMSDTNEDDLQSFHPYTPEVEEYTRLKINPVKQFKTICSLNVTVRKVESDGNCFFRALSDQLCATQEGHLVLRCLIMDYIHENRDTYEPSIDHEHFQNWEDFINRMRQHGTFVDGIVVAASAFSLRRSIIIHQETRRPVLFKPSFCNTNCQQIHLAYDCKALHYNSLCSMNDNKLYIDVSECTLG